MKYIITENKMEKVIFHFLNTGYGDLEEVVTSEYPDNHLFVKDKSVYMDFNNKRAVLMVDNSIMDDLENWFSLKKPELEKIIKQWVNLRYDMGYVRFIGTTGLTDLYSDIIPL